MTTRIVGTGVGALTVLVLTLGATRVAGQVKGENGAELFIKGPDNLFIAPHGSSKMPVWGPTFRALDPSGDNERRLSQIRTYIEFLQAR